MTDVPGAVQLRPADREPWTAYVAARKAGVRRRAQEHLDVVTEAVLAYDEDSRGAFVEAVLRAWIDPLPPLALREPFVRHPLAGRLVLPYLLRGVEQNDPDQARRLAVLVYLGALTPDEHDALPEGLGVYGLLRRAIADDRAAAWLLALMVDGVAYDFHGVPSGLLGEAAVDGDRSLDELEELAARLGRTDEIAAWLPHARALAASWRRYVTEPERYGSYAAALEADGVPPHPPRLA